MGHPRFSSEEIARRGEELYQQQIRGVVETDENIGKIVGIDIETGEYEIAELGLEAANRLRSRHPDAAIFAVRVGYDAVYSLGGVLTRTKVR